MAILKKEDLTIRDIINIANDGIQSLINCCKIGRITEFNAEKWTVTAEILQVMTVNNQNYIPTVLTEVPLLFYGSGSANITMPNPIGKNCLLLFCDRNIDNFLLTGQRYLPDNNRKHSFADAVALLTINSFVDEAPMYDENALTISNNEQFIKIFNNSIELYSEKIKIYNATTTLLTLINNLIDTIKGITTEGTSTAQAIDETSKQALEELKANFGELLQ